MPGNGDWTKRYATGDTWNPRADWLNNVTKTAQAFSRESGGFQSSSRGRRSPDGLVVIKNGSGADVDQYSILGLNGVVIEPTDNLPEFQAGPVFFGDTPNTGDTFVVCAEPIAQDKCGVGFIFGVCACQINIISTDHEFADVINGDNTQLQSAAGGPAKILYSESGTGKKWAVILFGAPAPPILLFTISTNATGNEEYNGRSIGGGTTQTASTNLSGVPAGMTTASADDLLVLNVGASGGSGHTLTAGSLGAGVVVGTTTETTPRRIVWGFGLGGGGSLPTPTAAYQVLQVSAYTDSSHFTLDFDFLRLG